MARISMAVVASPTLMAIVLLYSFAIRVAFAVGHWPSYGNPDPKSVGMDFHYEVVYNAMGVAIILPPVLGLLGCLFLVANRRVFPAVACLLLGFAGLAFLILDPNDLFNWLAD